MCRLFFNLFILVIGLFCIKGVMAIQEPQYEVLLKEKNLHQNDFITNWVSLVKPPHHSLHDTDKYAKLALQHSYQNCLTFPWIQEKLASKSLILHLWFFDIHAGQIFMYSESEKAYIPLDSYPLN